MFRRFTYASILF